MTKKGRLLRTVLLLALFLSLFPPIRAGAEEVNKVEFIMAGPNGADVFHGDTVCVQIKADGDFITHGMGMTIAYDDTVLAPLPEECTVPEDFHLSGPMTVEGKTVLRISVFPDKEKGYSFDAGTILAQLKFKALNPTQESTAVEMTAVHNYGENLTDIPAAPAGDVQFRVKPVSVESVILNWGEYILELGDTAQLTATVFPENASEKTLIWTSSDAETVKVVDGFLEARKLTYESPVIITATTKDGGFVARCSVQVVTPPDEDYVVSIPKTARVDTMNDDIVIPVTVANAREDVETFNAYDIVLTYDPEALEFVPAAVREGMRVEHGEGTLRILGWGEPKSMGDYGAEAFAVTFKPIKKGSSFVTIERARVDYSANALLSNASKATLQPEYEDEDVSYRTAVVIAGYKVIADETVFRVPSYVASGNEDFVISLKEYDHYDFENLMVTIGGVDRTNDGVFNQETGVYTIPKELINGEIRISAERTPKHYRVTIVTDEETTYDEAVYNTNYSFEADVDHTVEVLIGDTEYEIQPNEDGTYIIPGTAITGDIEIYITKKSSGDDGSGDSEGSGDSDGTGGSDDDTGGSGGSDDGTGGSGGTGGNGGTGGSGGTGSSGGTGNSGSSGTTTNKNNTTNKTTTTTKTSTDTVKAESLEVTEYVTLGEESLYLIVYKFNSNGYIPKYDGQSMYRSEAYNAYVWLIASEQTDTELADAVLKKITIATGKSEDSIDYSGDVNMSDSIDTVDAELVWEMYHAQYSLENMEMQKLLNADLNMDKKVDIRDVLAAVRLIS